MQSNAAFWEDIDADVHDVGALMYSSSASSVGEGTLGNDFSSFLNPAADDSRDEGQAKLLNQRFWIHVAHLEYSTTEAALQRMFYPYGADEAFLSTERGLLVGYVGFDTRDLCALAVEKMNAFIPCRQTQALSVRIATIEEVTAARFRVPSYCCSEAKQPLREGTLMSASDCVDSLKRARSIPELQATIGSLAEHYQSFPGFPQYREDLLKELLRLLLNAAEEQEAAWIVNSGIAIGFLFLRGVLPGDPFLFVSRLLQRCPHTVAHLDGICSCAQVCREMPFPLSKASFWAQVGQLSWQMQDPAIRSALLSHLRCSTVGPQKPVVDAVSDNAGADGNERARTVYVSHLPPTLPLCALREMLSSYGVVNKVRICRSPGYKTLFAFVEMQDTHSVNQMMMFLNGLNVCRHSIRVQLARSPIQDILKEDAQYCNGTLVQPCLFGIGPGALRDCISAFPRKQE